MYARAAARIFSYLCDGEHGTATRRVKRRHQLKRRILISDSRREAHKRRCQRTPNAAPEARITQNIIFEAGQLITPFTWPLSKISRRPTISFPCRHVDQKARQRSAIMEFVYFYDYFSWDFCVLRGRILTLCNRRDKP